MREVLKTLNNREEKGVIYEKEHSFSNSLRRTCRFFTEAGGNAPAWNRGGRGGMGGPGGQRWGGRGGMGAMGPGGMGGGMRFGGGSGMLGRLSKEGEIQKKFPEEYAKIAKQLIDAENALQELAKKAKVELPAENNNVLRQLKMKAPAEFADIENKLKERETMREGFEKLRALAEKHNLKLGFFMMRGGMRGGEAPAEASRPQMRRNDVAKINAVREKFPAEWQKVLELRRSNKHREAGELTRELIQRLDNPRPQKAAENKAGK